MLLLSGIFFALVIPFGLLLNEHVVSSDIEVSVTSTRSITRKLGEDVILMWNITNGQTTEVRWGLLKDGLLSPQLIYMSTGFGPVISSDLNADALRYKGRVSWVGDLDVGHAWFKIKNLTIQDTNQYIAAIHELGTTKLIRSWIALTVIGSARFTQVPPRLLHVPSGATAKLVWDYHVDSRDDEFIEISPIWSCYSKSDGAEQRIAFEYNLFGRWSWIVSSECPPRLLNPTRVKKESRATLVIYNVTTSDSGMYGCSLMLKTGQPITSKVELIVQGRAVEAFIDTEETTPMEAVPDSPKLITASATELSITLNWNKPDSHGYPVLMYSVHRLELGEGEQEVTYHVNEDVHDYEVGDVEGGKSYKLYVTAWNTHGESVKEDSRSTSVKLQTT